MADVMELIDVLRLEGAELGSLPGEQLERVLVSWSSSMAASEYRWLRLVAEFDRRQLYLRWECQNSAKWLMWRCGLDQRAAHEKVRVARALESLPLVAAAFERGELSYSKVRAITRVAHCGIEQALVDTARSIHTAGLEQIVSGIRRARVLNHPERAEHQPAARRSVTYRYDEDGTVVMTARLPAEDHAVLRQAIDALLEEDRKQVPIERRRADALVEVAARALDAGPSSSSTADRYQVVVHIDAAVLTSDDPNGQCRIDNGPALAADTARRLCCDGSVVRLYTDHDGRPVAVSAKTRTVPAAMRRALRTRDRTCRFPGCTHHAWLDAHHHQHWTHGGPTNLDNLLLLCRRHHRAVHEGRWTITSQPDGTWQFTNPHGTTLQPPATDIHDITIDVHPDAITPHWYDQPDHHYIVSVLADPPDPTWN